MWKATPGGVLLIWLVIFFSIGLFINPEPVSGPDGTMIFAGLLFFSAGLSWILYIEAVGTHVRADNVGVHIRSLWRPGRTVEWYDIKTIRYNALGDSLVIIGSGRRIKFHLAMSDREHWVAFLRRLHERVSLDKVHDEDIRKGILKAVAEGSSEPSSTDTGTL